MRPQALLSICSSRVLILPLLEELLQLTRCWLDLRLAMSLAMSSCSAVAVFQMEWAQQAVEDFIFAVGKTHRKHGWLYMHPLYLMRTPHSGAHGAASLLSLRATDVIVGA
mmetsp:Transcript_6182/g.14797  ORF Transcript_6182/g.14797 Transcript_6182/m.14797 type:complete len:110 (-) Transcript_6182:298-627(-)